jgi:flagellar capping protein FliD
LEKAFNQLKRKGENLTAEDEKRFDEEISKANFKIDILTERASQHYRTSLRKFEKMDDMLMRHPLLKALQKNKV